MRWLSAFATMAGGSRRRAQRKAAASAWRACASACRRSAAASRFPARRERASRCGQCCPWSGSRLRREQARAHGDERELRRVRGAELLLDVVQVGPDGAWGERHDLGDVLHRLTAGQGEENLELFLAQAVERIRGPGDRLPRKLLGNLWLEEGPAVGHLADRLDEGFGCAALGEIPGRAGFQRAAG